MEHPRAPGRSQFLTKGVVHCCCFFSRKLSICGAMGPMLKLLPGNYATGVLLLQPAAKPWTRPELPPQASNVGTSHWGYSRQRIIKQQAPWQLIGFSSYPPCGSPATKAVRLCMLSKLRLMQGARRKACVFGSVATLTNKGLSSVP